MIHSILGIIISIIYSKIFLPKQAGGNPTPNPTCYPFLYRGMFIIPYSKEKALHIHHWILFTICFLVSLIIPGSDWFMWFSLGMLIQGLTYPDCFDIICPNPYLRFS